MRLTRRLTLSMVVVVIAVAGVIGVAMAWRMPQRVQSLRPANDAAAVDAVLYLIRRDIAFAVLAALAGGSFAVWKIARAIGRPVESLRDAACAVADGDPSRRLPLLGTGDVADLADAIRRLSDESTTRLNALQAEEARLVALTESLNEGVVALDARQRVVRINQTARRILRLRDEVPFPADYLPRDRTLREALAAVLRGEDVMPSDVRVDDRTLSLTARPLPDGGAILALYDLTPFRRLEAVRRDFVANVSHELRTPLTVVSGFVETLTDDALPPDLRRQFLGMTAANVRRMQRIVDDLLDLSRIESGGWLPNASDLDVRALVTEIIAPLREQAEAKGVVLDAEIAEDTRTVYIDPTAARQILSNLTENALRHTSAGSVMLFAERTDEGVWLGVRDTGTGIPEEHLPRIFERFYRADPGRSREAGGTGLGLSIVRHLAEAHGGRVRAESTAGVGTTIAVLLPPAER